MKYGRQFAYETHVSTASVEPGQQIGDTHIYTAGLTPLETR
jgi:hypothetical protein